MANLSIVVLRESVGYVGKSVGCRERTIGREAKAMFMNYIGMKKDAVVLEIRAGCVGGIM